jgi:hypothetical protein
MAITVQNSVAKLTKLGKLRRLGAALAIALAKQNNDPMYEKYAAIRSRYKSLKASLIAKYKSKAKQKLGTSF